MLRTSNPLAIFTLLALLPIASDASAASAEQACATGHADDHTQIGQTQLDDNQTDVIACLYKDSTKTSAIWKGQYSSNQSGWVVIDPPASWWGFANLQSAVYSNGGGDLDQMCKNHGYQSYAGQCRDVAPGTARVIHGAVMASRDLGDFWSLDCGGYWGNTTATTEILCSNNVATSSPYPPPSGHNPFTPTPPAYPTGGF